MSRPDCRPPGRGTGFSSALQGVTVDVGLFLNRSDRTTGAELRASTEVPNSCLHTHFPGSVMAPSTHRLCAGAPGERKVRFGQAQDLCRTGMYRPPTGRKEKRPLVALCRS